MAKETGLPVVLHVRGESVFEPMLDILRNHVAKDHPIQWHCVNADSNLSILDSFLNEYDRAYVSINGSSISNENFEKQKGFQKRLKSRKDFLEKFTLETDFPFLAPANIAKEEYTPLTGLVTTAIFLVDTMRKAGLHPTKVIELANYNTRRLFGIP
ncbi:unnamed protein product [Didymodactylos carnosus]|uniref:Uncharacterized protein n=1 Tax=Didymodactylos carnosus TaxID=1234261 RepID=A0A8S2CLQ7_9BILA|nr:unnamed protein product [Didymodactylos carnosus]CAF3519558.1 unnamed protein product [Didymodactylos carnosus]